MGHQKLLMLAEEIPHQDQRYPTCGDYFTGPTGLLHFRISSMPDWRYARLVLIHELIEQTLCQDAGVSEKAIDAFDIKFEGERARGKHSPTDEPGDDPRAPYRRQHLMATAIEKMLAAALGVNWKVYDAAVSAL